MLRPLAMTALVAALATPAHADLLDLGAAEFTERCAVCHGTGGKGDGPLASILRIESTDLTQLAAQNEGSFPFEWVYRVIDGRAEVAAHGPRTMPVWGHDYKAITNAERSIYERNRPTEDIVAERILALTRYLETIQE